MRWTKLSQHSGALISIGAQASVFPLVIERMGNHANPWLILGNYDFNSLRPASPRSARQKLTTEIMGKEG